MSDNDADRVAKRQKWLEEFGDKSYAFNQHRSLEADMEEAARLHAAINARDTSDRRLGMAISNSAALNQEDYHRERVLPNMYDEMLRKRASSAKTMATLMG